MLLENDSKESGCHLSWPRLRPSASARHPAATGQQRRQWCQRNLGRRQPNRSRQHFAEELTHGFNLKPIKQEQKRRFAERCRNIALGVWSASILLLASASPQAFAATPVEVTGFGSNPGNLKMYKYIPDQLPPSAPLVVVMHGCTQNALTFASESGWILQEVSA